MTPLQRINTRNSLQLHLRRLADALTQRDLADVKVSEFNSRTLHGTLDDDRHAGCAVNL